MTIADAKAMITDNGWDFDFEKVGIRIQEPSFELGEIAHVSHNWIDNDDTGEELNGICVLDISSREAPLVYDDLIGGRAYFGDHVALIGGDLDEYGQDPGEVVLKNAVVLYVIK